MAAIAGAFPYAFIAGATVQTQRALLMVGKVLVAVILDRRGLSIRLVAWAALAILVVAPESLLGPGFQISFAAVTALIATYETLSERRQYREYEHSRLPPWVREAMFYLAGVALTTLIAGVATAPFAIFHFNRFAGYGLAANLIAVPVTALWVIPWAMAAFLLMLFGFKAAALTPMGVGDGCHYRRRQYGVGVDGRGDAVAGDADGGLGGDCLGRLMDCPLAIAMAVLGAGRHGRRAGTGYIG